MVILYYTPYNDVDIHHYMMYDVANVAGGVYMRRMKNETGYDAVRNAVFWDFEDRKLYGLEAQSWNQC